MDYSGKTGGGDFKQPNFGLQAARIFKIVDIGTQEDEFEGKAKLARKMLVFFELAQLTEDNRPFTIFKEYNQNIRSERATLRKHMQSWKGKAMTKEMIEDFDAKALLGEVCMVNLVESKSGKAKVDNILALPEGFVSPKAANDNVFLDLDAFDEKTFNELAEWVQKKIALSPEYRRAVNPEPDPAPKAEVTSDDIPF